MTNLLPTLESHYVPLFSDNGLASSKGRFDSLYWSLVKWCTENFICFTSCIMILRANVLFVQCDPTLL